MVKHLLDRKRWGKQKLQVCPTFLLCVFVVFLVFGQSFVGVIPWISVWSMASLWNRHDMGSYMEPTMVPKITVLTYLIITWLLVVGWNPAPVKLSMLTSHFPWNPVWDHNILTTWRTSFLRLHLNQKRPTFGLLELWLTVCWLAFLGSATKNWWVPRKVSWSSIFAVENLLNLAVIHRYSKKDWNFHVLRLPFPNQSLIDVMYIHINSPPWKGL